MDDKKYYEITEYKGVKIVWDEDHDERIFLFIDSLTDKERDNLDTAGEHEGSLELIWKEFVPKDYQVGKIITIYNKYEEYQDEWYIFDSNTIFGKMMEKEKEYDIHYLHRDIKEKIIIKEEISRIIDKQTRYNILKEQKWRCNNCGCSLKFSKNSEWDGEIAHIDHIHAFSKRDSYINGSDNINERSNLQALCQKCNNKKSAKNG